MIYPIKYVNGEGLICCNYKLHVNYSNACTCSKGWEYCFNLLFIV